MSTIRVLVTAWTFSLFFIGSCAAQDVLSRMALPAVSMRASPSAYFAAFDRSNTAANGAPAEQSCPVTASSLSIVAWGDSLTEGPLSKPSYPDQLALLIGHEVTNKGVSGNTSSQIASRMLAAPEYFGHPTIIWAGHNNWNEPTRVKADVASMVAALTTSHYLVLGVVNGAGQVKGSPVYSMITQMNRDLAAVHGSHFIDIRSYLVSLYDANSAPDVIDYADDVLPSSLRYDGLHLNSRGNGVVATKIATHLPTLICAAALRVQGSRKSARNDR